MQINFIFSNNVCILRLSCNIKKSKTTAKLSENGWNKRHCNSFQRCHLWRQHLYCYHFFLLLNRNQVPEKLYFGQWPYIAKIYPVNAIWLLNQWRITQIIILYYSSTVWNNCVILLLFCHWPYTWIIEWIVILYDCLLIFSFFFDRSEKLDEKDVELDTDDASQVVPFLADDIKPVTKDTDDTISNSQSKIDPSQEEEEEYEIEDFDYWICFFLSHSYLCNIVYF